MLNARVFILLAVMSVVMFAVGSAAESLSKGALDGRVLNRTIDGKGISGLEIVLHQLKEDKKTVVGRTQSDAAGSFSFKGLSAEKNIVYSVSTDYSGVEYFSEPLHLDDEGALAARLIIYETTEQAPDLYVKMHHIFFQKAEGGLQVKEAMIVENSGKRTIVGSGGIDSAKKETFQISLPDQAAELQYMPPLKPVGSELKPGLSSSAPIRPGTSQFIFEYTVPYSGGSYTLSKSLEVKTNAVSVVYFDKDLRIESNRLVPTAAPSASDKPVYQLFGKNFAGGSRLNMRLTFSRRTDHSKWIAIALPGFVLGIGIAVSLWKGRGNSAAEPDSAEDLVPDSLPGRRQSLLRALAALDDQFESGALDSPSYRRKRGLLLEEAKKLSRKLRLGSQSFEVEKS